jgi:hypothetical protein
MSATWDTKAVKATPIGADEVLVIDTENSRNQKRSLLNTIPSTATINFVIDGGGSAITTGIKGDLTVGFGGTINRVEILGDQSGSIVIDIWKDTYANFPPTNADTITASATPTVTTALKSEDTTLTGWTTALSAGDILRYNVDSITSFTRVTIALRVLKTG